MKLYRMYETKSHVTNIRFDLKSFSPWTAKSDFGAGCLVDAMAMSPAAIMTPPHFSADCTDVEAFFGEVEECFGRMDGAIEDAKILPKLKQFVDRDFRNEMDAIVAAVATWNAAKTDFRRSFEAILGIVVVRGEEHRQIVMEEEKPCARYVF